MPVNIYQLTLNGVPLMKDLLSTFGKAFDDVDIYTSKCPSADYLERLLGGDSFIALVALKGEEVVGGMQPMN